MVKKLSACDASPPDAPHEASGGEPGGTPGSFEGLPHPRALAFLGDAAYELFLREMALHRGLSFSRDLHGLTTTLANAEAQVSLLRYLEPHLREPELELIRRGRNLGVSAGRRSGQSVHRQATSFEVLIGALHLQDPARLRHLLSLARPFLEGLLGE